MIKRWIEVQTIKEGIHRYPAAETDPHLLDVKYLSNEHFHYFYITVKIEIFHNDRCLEFQQFRRYIESLFSENIMSLDFKSCEMIAESLHEIISRDFPNREMKIRVAEDNINAAELEFINE